MDNGLTQVQLPSDSTNTNPQNTLIAGKYTSEDELSKGVMELIKRQYSTTDAMVGFYKSLESNIGKPVEQTPQAPQTPTPTPAPQTPSKNPLESMTIKAVEQQTGLDLAVYEKEYFDKGELSPESYASLVAKGIPKQVVDAYIEGRVAVVERAAGEVYKIAGGPENYSTMIQWAATNLPRAEQEAFNVAINSNDMGQMKLATEALFARYSRATGSTPDLVNGGSGASLSNNVYHDLTELHQDQRDPRYRTDPAFRDAVVQKLMRSKL